LLPAFNSQPLNDVESDTDGVDAECHADGDAESHSVEEFGVESDGDRNSDNDVDSDNE